MVLDLVAADRWQAIDAMLDRACAVGAIAASSRDLVRAAVVAREMSLATGLEAGLAIPHGFTPMVPGTVAIVARTAAGVDFQALDGEPTRLIVLLVAPDSDTGRGTHLRLLSSLALALGREEVRRGLLAAPDTQAFTSLLRASLAARP